MRIAPLPYMIRSLPIKEEKEVKNSFSVSITHGDLSRIGASGIKKIEFVKINPLWEKATYRFVEPDYTPINVGPKPK